MIPAAPLFVEVVQKRCIFPRLPLDSPSPDPYLLPPLLLMLFYFFEEFIRHKSTGRHHFVCLRRRRFCSVLHVLQPSQFAADHLEAENSSLTYVQVKAEVQVVAGLMYTLHYEGKDGEGVCKVRRCKKVVRRCFFCGLPPNRDCTVVRRCLSLCHLCFVLACAHGGRQFAPFSNRAFLHSSHSPACMGMRDFARVPCSVVGLTRCCSCRRSRCMCVALLI